MKTFLIIAATLIACFGSVDAAWNKIYEGDNRIQWFNMYASGNTIVATGYILDNNGPVYEGKILTSTDGGVNWKLNSYPNTFIKSVSFKSTNEGFIGGFGPLSNSYIYKTTNGGVNWNIALYDTKYAGITQLQMVNSNIGFAAGYGSAQFESANCYRTTDGGNTWISASGSIPAITFEKSFFPDENTGYAISDIVPDYNFLYKSTDAGATWNEIPLNGPRADGAYFWDSNNFIILGDGGRMDKSTDGGKTFTQIQSNTTQDLRGISFYNQIGYAVGINGAVIKSTDGGATWATENIGYTANLNNVIFNDKGDAFIFGEGNLIVSTASVQKPVKLEADATEIQFNTDKPGLEDKQSVELKNNSQSTITINSINIADNSEQIFTISNINLPKTINAGESLDIEVSYKAKQYGSSENTLTITSTADNSPLSILLNGVTEKPMGTIYSDIESVEFDVTDINTTNQKTVKIKNIGLLDLEINQINLSNNADGVFSIKNAPSLPLTISANNSITLNLEFKPLELKKSSTAELHIKSDDQDMTDYTIHLSGMSSDVNGVNDLSDDCFGASFNALNNLLQIENCDNSEIRIIISDLNGKNYFTGKVNSFPFDFNTQQLPSGAYFMSIIKSDKTYLKKFIK